MYVNVCDIIFVYTYGFFLFSFVKEEDSDICYMMVNLEDTMLSEISQLQKKK